ncbi:hypothetical protein HRF87_05670 [Bacillus sp. CRN 9]|nr:hypothetical protein [Bacillus sp. CRN 9]
MLAEIKPIATFEWQAMGAFIALYPSIKLGCELVLCGVNKNDKLIVQHDCRVCRNHGHQECPYVKTTLYLFMLYKKQRFKEYSIKFKRVNLREEWVQIQIPTLETLKIKGEIGIDHFTKHS